MQTVEGYRVLEGDSPRELREQVEELLADGWVPIGGVSVLRWTYELHDGDYETAWRYTQAMVKPRASS